MPYAFLHPITCEYCGKVALKDTPKRRYCSKSCSAAHRFVLKPEMREVSRKNMEKLRADPEVQEKLRQHLSSESNPFRDPLVKERSLIALAETGYWMLNGGNGRQTAEPQRRLHEMLGPGWVLEHVVRTGASWLPYHYKLDIAYPEKMICVEVDGASHNSRRVREADKRKDQWLRDHGWTVVRVRNADVSEATASAILKLAPATTLPVAS